VGVAVLVAVPLARGRFERRTPAEFYAEHPAARGTADALVTLWPVPAFSLTSQRGVRVTDRALRGHAWIADFIFTQCTSSCPLITARMAMLQRHMTDPSLRFVSFSVDPDHDTPEALAAYAASWRPGERRWELLSTTRDDLERVAAGMHVVAERTGETKDPIAHTSLLFLVDAHGAVRGAYDSDDAAAMDRLVADAGKLGAAAAPERALGAQRVDGEALYAALGCGACHTRADVAPPLEGIAGRRVHLEQGQEVTADAAYVKESIQKPAAKMVDGYLRLMPSYDGALTDAELDALVAYVMGKRAAPSPATTTSAPSPVASAAGMPSSVTPRATTSTRAPSAPASGAADAPPAAPIVETDPVCGMPVRVIATTPAVTEDGHVAHFCSERCRDAFVARHHPTAAK
jgi:protein SCO1/2